MMNPNTATAAATDAMLIDLIVVRVRFLAPPDVNCAPASTDRMVQRLPPPVAASFRTSALDRIELRLRVWKPVLRCATSVSRERPSANVLRPHLYLAGRKKAGFGAEKT